MTLCNEKFNCNFPHHSTVILLSTHVDKNVVSGLKYARRTSRLKYIFCFVVSVLNFNSPLKKYTSITKYRGIANYQSSCQIFSHYNYLIWTIIITYETITLTTLVKSFKFSEKNPHAVSSFFIACSWRENILSSCTHSFLQFLSNSNFCTKILEYLPSFVAVWKRNRYLEEEHIIHNCIYYMCYSPLIKINKYFI
jgi:hypothetical protein